MAVRAENRAAAAQWVAMGELFAYRLSRCAETEEWAVDTEAAVAAEVAAQLRIPTVPTTIRRRFRCRISPSRSRTARIWL